MLEECAIVGLDRVIGWLSELLKQDGIGADARRLGVEQFGLAESVQSYATVLSGYGVIDAIFGENF